MGKEAKPAAMREGRDIEWLVNWALEKQRVDRTDGGAGMGPAAVRSQLGSLGMKVDGGHGVTDKRPVHADAVVIWDALSAMQANAQVGDAVALVVQHGRLGTQPDWGRDGCGRYVLQRRNAGQGRAIKRYADKRNARGVIGFEWKWVGHTQETLELLMLEWLAWHGALRDLRELINSRMRTYVATGPVWLVEPWDDPVYISATRAGGMGAHEEPEE